MTPSEIRLFTPKEQTLLIETEPARLSELSEDDLSDLLGRYGDDTTGLKARLRWHAAEARKGARAAAGY